MKRIKIAIQKSGRLSQSSLKLLNNIGIDCQFRSGQLLCHSKSFPMDLLLVRDDDIPTLVNDGVCDLGIVGTNVLEEEQNLRTNNTVILVDDLNFGVCRLSIAVPTESPISDIQQLSGKRIATSYPVLLEKYLQKNSVNALITTLSGAIEIAPRVGIADAICDLVSTGATLEANGLVELSTLMQSQAVLIQNKQIQGSDKLQLISQIQTRIESVLQAEQSQYVMLHTDKRNLEDILVLLPGSEQPTVIPLSEDKLAVHAVCYQTIFWETLEKIKQCGASSILVVPIKKMMV